MILINGIHSDIYLFPPHLLFSECGTRSESQKEIIRGIIETSFKPIAHAIVTRCSSGHPLIPSEELLSGVSPFDTPSRKKLQKEVVKMTIRSVMVTILLNMSCSMLKVDGKEYSGTHEEITEEMTRDIVWYLGGIFWMLIGFFVALLVISIINLIMSACKN